MDNEKQHKVFISYSRVNAGFAIKLAKELKSEGFYIWLDVLDIPNGSRWDDEVFNALKECKVFMIILSPSAIASQNVKDESGYAIDSRKDILPLLLENCDVPFRLRRFSYVDFTTRSFDDGIEHTKELLRKLFAAPAAKPILRYAPETPIRGDERKWSPQEEAERRQYELAATEAEEERIRLEKQKAAELATKKTKPDSNETEHIKPISQNEVFFTAYHPTFGTIETWHTLLVYAHIFPMIEKVHEDAKRFNDQIKSPKETTSKSSAPIVRGTELTIIPSCESIAFNPEHVSFKWMEDFHRADFRFKADKSLSGDAAKGSIDIYVGPIIVGTLKFAMLFTEKDAQSVPDHEESIKMYSKDDVFISYSRKDSDVARTFKTVLEGTGLDVFLDVDDIRSGQLWEKELKRRIEQAKIFQIFWSENYSQSQNCKQEWEYALQQNKDEGYIRPVFWEKPLSPKPPEELNKFNFKYVEINTSKD